MKIDQAGEQGLFIDFQELFELAQSGQVTTMPVYQEILQLYPQLIAANIDVDYGRKIFISHRWDAVVDGDPPDPTGWQLNAIGSYGQELKHSEELPACFWYDYCSLPQELRTAGEQLLFDRGLNHVQRLCRDCTIVALISNKKGDPQQNVFDMLGRGWILTELFVGSRHERVTIALFEDTDYLTYAKRHRPQWSGVIPDLQDVMPYHSEAVIHAWLVQSGVKCTNGADLLILAKLLHRELASVPPSLVPPPSLAFDTSTTMDEKTAASYRIDRKGLSGHFPDTYFEVSGRAGIQLVTARERPVLSRLGQPQVLTDQGYRKLRIDETSGRSPMYPGIAFQVQRELGTPSTVTVTPRLIDSPIT